MRLIGADDLLKRESYFADRDFINPKYDDTLRDIINRAPTLDAVPVVRCKDCAKWDKGTMEHYEDVFSGSGDTAECRMFCDMDTWGEFTDNMRRTDGNWFCADGERRESE